MCCRGKNRFLFVYFIGIKQQQVFGDDDAAIARGLVLMFISNKKKIVSFQFMTHLSFTRIVQKEMFDFGFPLYGLFYVGGIFFL